MQRKHRSLFFGNAYNNRHRLPQPCGVAPIQSLLLLCLSAVFLLGVHAYFGSETGILGETSRAVARLFQDDASSAAAAAGAGNQVTIRIVTAAGGQAGASGSATIDASNATASDDEQQTLESQLYREWHAIQDELTKLRAQGSRNPEAIALLEERYRVIDSAITAMDRVDTIGPKDETVASFVADFTPIVSQVKAAYELGKGVNPITGEQLTPAERALAAAGLIPWGKVFQKATVAAKEGEVLADAAHIRVRSANLTPASSVNAGAALNSKLGALEKAQLEAGVGSANPSGLTAAESWGRPGTLARHFADHGADFGATSAEEYAQQASRFLQESQVRGLPTKIGPDGVIRVYDPATNTFGAYNANGTTRTFYTPNPPVHGYPTNLDYWNHQPGVVPWNP